MVKGINKRIVEVNMSDSEYFEKAVMFLRPDAPENGAALSDEARLSAYSIETGCMGIRRRNRSGFKKVICTLFRAAAELSMIVCAAASVMHIFAE